MMINRARKFLAALAAFALFATISLSAEPEKAEGRRLYVAEPGIRDLVEYGGHGLLVYDIDHGHKLIKRIPTAGLRPNGKPDNVKGVCASAATGRIHISTTKTLTCLDLVNEKILWERSYDGGCDRMALSPDGKTIYLPSFEGDHWNVVDAIDGSVIAKITPKSGAHNTVFGADGKHVYLAGLRSPLLTVADASKHVAERTIGPFSAAIRPFTVDGRQTRCYATVNGLLGFEIGDLKTNKPVQRVVVSGFQPGPVKRHGCPSHGVGLTPDEKEIWVVDGHNQQVHIFDITVDPPRQTTSIPLREEPGWITFSIDGQYAYPSTGEVIDAKTKKTVTTLSDEKGSPVLSEKMVEIDFEAGKPVRTGDQFGIGRVIDR
jgi:DNA-binding beta-propeller fold protein YncE